VQVGARKHRDERIDHGCCFPVRVLPLAFAPLHVDAYISLYACYRQLHTGKSTRALFIRVNRPRASQSTQKLVLLGSTPPPCCHRTMCTTEDPRRGQNAAPLPGVGRPCGLRFAARDVFLRDALWIFDRRAVRHSAVYRRVSCGLSFHRVWCRRGARMRKHVRSNFDLHDRSSVPMVPAPSRRRNKV
jgi:hypothetical protein